MGWEWTALLWGLWPLLALALCAKKKKAPDGRAKEPEIIHPVSLNYSDATTQAAATRCKRAATNSNPASTKTEQDESGSPGQKGKSRLSQEAMSVAPGPVDEKSTKSPARKKGRKATAAEDSPSKRLTSVRPDIAVCKVDGSKSENFMSVVTMGNVPPPTGKPHTTFHT